MLNFKNRIGLPCIMAALYFLMLPLTISVNSAGSSFLKIASVPIGAFFLITSFFTKKPVSVNMVHVMFMAYTLSTILTLFVDSSAESVSIVLGYVLNAGLFTVISVVSYNKDELEFLENIQVVLLIIITALTLFDNVGSGRETLTILGQSSDPNYFVGYFVFPTTITLKKIIESKWRIFYIVLALLGLYVIFLSGSRGGLLSIIVTFLAFAIIYPEGIKKKATVLLVLAVSAMVFWVLVSPHLPENIVERMNIESVIETRGTYRGDIWESMINEIKDSSWEVIFGRGINAKHTMIIAGKLHSEFAHNHYIQLLYNQGFLGLITFFLFIGTAIGRCIKKRKCVSIAIIGMMALVFSLSVNPSMKTFWNLIPYAAFAFPVEKKENIHIKEDAL